MVIEALYAKAMGGDKQAAEILLAYNSGKPQQNVNLEADAGPNVIEMVQAAYKSRANGGNGKK